MFQSPDPKSGRPVSGHAPKPVSGHAPRPNQSLDLKLPLSASERKELLPQGLYDEDNEEQRGGGGGGEEGTVGAARLSLSGRKQSRRHVHYLVAVYSLCVSI